MRPLPPTAKESPPWNNLEGLGEETKMHPGVLRRIVNARYVLERASTIQAESNEMSLSISLLLTHDAIEMLMLAILDHLNVTKGKREFMGFWSDIKAAGLQEPPDFIPMQSLNNARVAMKHHGNLPNPKVVQELLPRAKGFFENVLKSYCQMTYSDVSLIDLVPDQEVRTMLMAARQKFVDDDKPAAMADLKIAFHKLQNPEGKRLPKLHAPRRPSLPYEMKQAGWETYLDELHSFLEACASSTNALMVGINPLRYASFMRIGPSVSWASNGAHYVNHRSLYQNVTIENFDELVLFLVEYALRASEAYIPVAVRV
jgi:hypothetical protein